MEANLFRFIVTRPPQRVSEQELVRQSVETHPTGISQTELLQHLLLLRANQDRAGMRDRSRRYIAAGAPEYIGHLGELSTPIEQIDQWIVRHRSQLSSAALLNFIDSVLSPPVSSLVQSDGYQQDRRRVADSLLAHYIASDPALPSPAHLVGAMRLFGLLERMAADRASLQHPGELQRVLKAIVRLPSSLYPLPRFEDKEAAQREKLYQSRKEAYKKAQERAQDLADRIVRHRKAIAELLEGYEADHHLSLVQAGDRSSLVDEDDSSPIDGQPVDTGENTTSEPLCIFLTPESANRLSKATRELLADMQVHADRITVVETVNRLENRVAALAGELYRGSSHPQFVVIGNALVNAGDYVGDLHGWKALPDDHPFCPLPDSCKDAQPENPSASDADLIISPGEIPSITPRIGELMLVEQRLHRYELVEVAHIENVLIGEKKKRTHRRKRTEEEVLFIETEKTEEMEQDLQSTERFELQNETQEVIREETSMEAGLSVSAKYGWQVEVQADARTASSTAKEESRRSATNYSRDVTERAVSRVQERVLERRTHRVVVETEETNLHVLDNTKGKRHVVGVYRWVDKVYQAQVVSYGLRSMFEFVIPEPAAFLKFVMAARVTADLDLTKPVPPAYCLPGSSSPIPLKPQDIRSCNYMFWASKYAAANIEPPPPSLRIIGKAFNSSSTQAAVFTASENGIRVPEGYIAKRAWIVDDHGIVYALVGRHWLRDYPSHHGLALNYEDSDLPISLIRRSGAKTFIANIEVECLRTQTAYEKWQLSTYDAIMLAYNEQLAEYEDRIAAAQIQQGVAISGDNPLRNRQLERDELKRGAISVLTGQHFDAFESLRKNVGDNRYPQLDLPRVAKEGPFIRFFEQAFEWEHMAYLLYPYFWGRKDDWPKNVLLDDNDPLFAQFLRAGAARVVVPVRPGFEGAVNSYLAHGWPLPTGTGPVVPDEEGDQGNGQESQLPFLSLAAELQAQQGYDATPSAGTVKVKEGSAKVIGTGTAFEEDRDIGREIHIAGVKYHIAGVASETEITLERPYEGHSAAGLLYSLGPKYVGEPWEVRVPTSLVFLEDGTSALPEFS